MSKIRYEIDLTRLATAVPDDEEGVRPVTEADAADLASLMLDAYRNTIDYEDEDLDDAIAEVGSYLGRGQPLLEMSRVAVENGEIVSGVLLSQTEDGPFIDYVMTRASHKTRGLGALVTSHALTALAGAGHHKVIFYITDGNEPSERLFASLGAKATV